MKVTTNGGVVTLTSENTEEAVAMFALGLEQKPEPKKRKYAKRHNVARPCLVCGKVCGSGAGLSNHMKKTHKQ